VAGGAVTFTGLAENVRYVAYAGGVGVRFVVPEQGVYVLSGVTVSQALTLDLSLGATLKLANGVNAPLLTITAKGVTVRGGTIDGNLAGQTAYHYLVDSLADDTQISRVTFVNALACQVRLRWGTKGHKVLRCVFDGNGGVTAGAVTASRNAVEVHSSFSTVALNTFRDINQGHGVRVGRYLLTDPETVEGNVVALNQFQNMLDPVNESPAMKAEVNATHCLFAGNAVSNATRAFKADSCSHITFALNQLNGVLDNDGINAANCPFFTFVGNRLKGCGGGVQVGNSAIVALNTLENIGVGLEGTTLGGIRQDTTESGALVAFNVLKNVRRFPILLAGSFGRAIGNRLESCQAAASTAQIRTGTGGSTKGGEIAHCTVISPSSASGTVIAFQGTGDKLRVADNTLDGAADTGVSVFTTASPYLAGNIVGDATAPIALGSGVTDPAIGLNPGAPAGDVQVVATDANLTLTALLSPPVTLHTGTLTANRLVSAGGGYKGARFRVARSGAGAFTLTVASVKALSTGQWVDIIHDGTSWVVAASGTL
jgi:hypothetical protein